MQQFTLNTLQYGYIELDQCSLVMCPSGGKFHLVTWGAFFGWFSIPQ